MEKRLTQYLEKQIAEELKVFMEVDNTYKDKNCLILKEKEFHKGRLNAFREILSHLSKNYI